MTISIATLVWCCLCAVVVSGFIAFWVAFRLCHATEAARMDAIRLWFAAPIIGSFVGLQTAFSMGWAPNPPGWFLAALGVFASGWLYPRRGFKIGPTGLDFSGAAPSDGKAEKEEPDSSSAEPASLPSSSEFMPPSKATPNERP